jgi:AcrR family transcriptional regulator
VDCAQVDVVPTVRSTALSAAQARIVAVALGLFARHGVGGTSLGMIANEIGVTKAAVYHQYRTKEEIILAAAEAELARLEALLEVAEAQPSGPQAREALVTQIVDLTVERRRTTSTILSDPVIVRLFAEHEELRSTMHRLSRLLKGDDGRPGDRVPTVVLLAAISGAVMHPLVADLDDDSLRSELLVVARRLFQLD